MMFRTAALAACLTLSAGMAHSQVAAAEALARLPVKEITVFKDGHTFVLHEGAMPVDANGSVQLDYVPTPVIGTFWPYSAEKGARLAAVVATTRRVSSHRSALTIPELIEANIGARVVVSDVDNNAFEAEIVGRPEIVPSDGDRSASGPRPAASKSNLVLLKRDGGVIAFSIDRIRTLGFKGEFKKQVADAEDRNLLSLRLAWANNRPAKTAAVGMFYLQKGIRWIPSYKVTIDGKGSAAVKLQATLINEMTDLKDVTTNLVIGVPTFAFKDTIDPIALQQTLAQLSPYFDANSRMGGQLSNTLMTQARFSERSQSAPGPGGEEPPDLAGSGKNQDLFVFTVNHVSLKRGERMVLTVAEYSLKYSDVYTLDIPFAPPREVRASVGLNADQQSELVRLISAPKATHKIRLTNSSTQPLTTAPALIMNGDRVVSQGLMTYTPVKADVDLTLTTAVDIGVRKSEKEVKRTPNAEQWQGSSYGRVDMTGTIGVTNYRTAPVQVEVTRNVLGVVDKSDQGGEAAMLNAFEDGGYIADTDQPSWWRWYNWPHWWHHFNGVGRFKWSVKVDPGKTVDLGYTWHYFWQ